MNLQPLTFSQGTHLNPTPEQIERLAKRLYRVGVVGHHKYVRAIGQKPITHPWDGDQFRANRAAWKAVAAHVMKMKGKS